MIRQFSQNCKAALVRSLNRWGLMEEEHPAKVFWQQASPILAASLAISLLVLAGRYSGLLERLELEAYDRAIQSRPQVKPDPRLLIVAVTEADIKAQKRWPLSDQTLYELLKRLESYNPRVIGLDIYRGDIAHPPGNELLMRHLQTSQKAIAICKLSEGENDIGVSPPPGLPRNNLGFSDIVVDSDGIVRRSLLIGTPSKHSACQTPFSFAFQMIQHYLAAEGFKPEFTPEKDLKIGSTLFRRLQPTTGAYQNADAAGIQVLLDYRTPMNVARQVTLTQVLNGEIDPEWVRGRVVLIGVTAPSIDDAFYTPYSARIKQNPKMPGVEVHAQIVSDILGAVLDGKTLLWSWSDAKENLWIITWAVVGGILCLRIRHPVGLLAVAVVGTGAIVGVSYSLLLMSGWIPVISPILAFLGTGSAVLAYISYKVQQEQLAIADRVEEQSQNILLLQALLKEQAPSIAVEPPTRQWLTAPELEESTRQWNPDLPNVEESTRYWTPDSSAEVTSQWSPDGGTRYWDETVKQESVTHARNETVKQGETRTPMQTPTAPRPQPVSKPHLLGGRYKISRVLGAGGFARTYLAQDTQRPGHPECVIKHLVPARSDDRFLQIARRLFNTEAEILEMLGHHTRIPHLLAYFEQDQEFYLVEEFIKGHHLGEELPVDKRLSEAQVIELLVGILEILSFIHGYQVIHRDIKPSNIIRRHQDHTLCLIDFGAVKLIESPSDHDPSDHFTVAIGTKGYAPPEQLVGQPRLSSDIYAVGMIGIQALTGIAPQQLKQNSHTGTVMWQHLTRVRPEFAAVLDKMVCYHFNERYQSAAQVLAELKQLPAAPTEVVPILHEHPSDLL